jgi:hypothetical protein
MDAATVLVRSGTAFALRYIRASMQAGIEIDLIGKPPSYICSNGKRCCYDNGRTGIPNN